MNRRKKKKDFNFSPNIKSKIKNRALEIFFSIEITSENIELVKRVLRGEEYLADEKDLADLEIGDEIDLSYGVISEYSDNILFLTMLFNTSLVGRPYMKLVRH